MNYYEIWVNLKPGEKDMELVKAVNDYMGWLKGQGTIESWSIKRRKFGFGPAELGDFNISIAVKNLTQLDEAFNHAATRTGEVEKLHIEVYRRVVDFKSALYRDFPDDVRSAE